MTNQLLEKMIHGLVDVKKKSFVAAIKESRPNQQMFLVYSPGSSNYIYFFKSLFKEIL